MRIINILKAVGKSFLLAFLFNILVFISMIVKPLVFMLFAMYKLFPDLNMIRCCKEKFSKLYNEVG